MQHHNDHLKYYIPTSHVCRMSDEFVTGKETAARKGISMEFTYKTANLYIYPGSIPLTEALPG